MSYLENNLLPNEVVSYEWEVHWLYTLFMVLGLILWVLLMIPWIQAWWGMWLMGFAVVLVFLYQIIFILTTEIAVTNKRVIYKTWIIARDIFELQLTKVESARLEQTIFQRIIGAWTLIISWTWWHNKPIQCLAKPTSMRTVIYEEIEKEF